MLAGWLCTLPAGAQTTDDDEDIWRHVDLSEVDFKKERSYCVRLCGFYRYYEDGTIYLNDRRQKMYESSEGICELDVRYSKDEDDGVDIMVARNLVHPDRQGAFADYYELKPYTFLEKARQDPKRYRMETQGDTTRVYTKRGLAGTAVRDTVRQELRMSYNALSPDTAMNINLLFLRGHLSHVDTKAVYRLDSTGVDYVPQGNLKQIIFDGDWVITNSMGVIDEEFGFHQHMEFYVDSVAYLTRDEYKADKKLSLKQRRERVGYTLADIDRLAQKLGVPPVTAEQRQRIEDQLDWDDEFEQWLKTNRMAKTTIRAARKMAESEAGKKAAEQMKTATDKLMDNTTNRKEDE